MSTPGALRKAIVLGPGEGRSYSMGRIAAVFKADGDETERRYSISEWWLDPHTKGPGPHSHGAEDDVFYVIAGTMHIRVDQQWIAAPAGTFVLIPSGVTHDFENRSDARAGVLNFYSPGPFEQDMPAICDWYREHPAGDA